MADKEEKHVNITGRDIQAYVNRFDSPMEMMADAKSATDDYAKDVQTLIVSMSDLYKANVIPLALLDVTVEVRVHVMGNQVKYAMVGTPGLARDLAESLEKSEAEAGED